MAILRNKQRENNYYFICSTKICKGFGMIERENKNRIFRITKEHSIKYYDHTYYMKSIKLDKI